jgi:hypothetical protein
MKFKNLAKNIRKNKRVMLVVNDLGYSVIEKFAKNLQRSNRFILKFLIL